MMPTMDDLPFTVEEWDAEGLHRMEMIARAVNPVVGRAAYDAAVKLRPNAHILLRHGIRVVAENRAGNRDSERNSERDRNRSS